MGHARSERLSTSRYELRPRPPLATVAAAAATTVVGCALLVIYRVRSGSAGVLVVGMALLIFGVALAGSALLYAIRLRTVIELDAEWITIRRGLRHRRLQLTEIKNVSLDGTHLTLHTKASMEDAIMINPRRADDPSFSSLISALSQRLDASRGDGGTR